MNSLIRPIDWIDSQAVRMLELVECWANINSASDNVDGLAHMAAELGDAFSPLGGQMKLIDLVPRQIIDSSGQLAQRPLGRALSIIKRPDAPLRVFLGGRLRFLGRIACNFSTTSSLSWLL